MKGPKHVLQNQSTFPCLDAIDPNYKRKQLEQPLEDVRFNCKSIIRNSSVSDCFIADEEDFPPTI